MIFKKGLILVFMLCFFASCSSQNKMETEDIFIKDICERLTEVLDAKVKIHEKKKGGQIEISYLNEADLQRIIDSLMNIYNLE